MTGWLFFLLIILACPLMMIFMMRGHGHGSHGGDTAHSGLEPATDSLDDLKRRRSTLNDEIASRENR